MNDKYTKQRKRLLEALDKGEDVSILELGMYDLTPYFDIDRFDVNLSEAIMLNKNFERRIQHEDKEIFFSPPQYDALKYLSDNQRVILSAPTSFGKTLLIKEYIHIHQPKHIVYIVPTNALAYELERSFKENENFNDYIIFDKCSEIEKVNVAEHNSEKLFFIGTQEKYLEIDREAIGAVDLFVIDEAYKLHESVKHQRAYKLSETFLDSVTNKSKKVFLLTPKAEFRGFDKYEFNLYESDFNAVEKNYTIVEKSIFFDLLMGKSIKEKSILFCKSPSQINLAYKEIENNNNNKDVHEHITKFVEHLETDIHPDWSVVKLLKMGVLTHHGQMPKYVQNRMINIFNENDNYNLLFGTNSISEGINTVTKNLFIHPDFDNLNDLLLIKNTIGRAGRLGKYPIGYIYSVIELDELVENEIIISLAISDEEELAEIEDSSNKEKILEFGERFNIDSELIESLLKNYKLSLNKLSTILEALRVDCKFSGITNLPFIANKAFRNDYTTIPSNDVILIKGYLQVYYIDNNERIFLNDFNDRLSFFKKHNKSNIDNTEIINAYMQFIYSTLEYYIMPIVNIGLDIYEKNIDWDFGDNVISSLEECKKKYYRKTYGSINFDDLTDSHKNIIASLKDYGMTGVIKNITVEILTEIEECLNVRYSTIDVLRTIDKLAKSSTKNKSFFQELKQKYML